MVITVSYFAYGRATAIRGELEGSLVLLALALAPAAFLLIAHISGIPSPTLRAFQAVALLVLLALPLGFLAPIFGASAGFAVGIVHTLNRPPFADVVRNRLVAALIALAYTFLLLVTVTPAGVMAGALVPPLMIGFADEYSAWRDSRR